MKSWCRKMMAAILLAVIGMGSAYAQDESDGDIYNQIASMEYKQWSFSPDWYYYNRYWGTVVDMPWPIPDVRGWLPGLGVHDNQGYVVPTLPYVPFYNFIGDNYVNEDWRQMYPLRVEAAAEAWLQAIQTEKEKNFWNKIQLKDLAVYTDRSTDMPLIGANAVTKDERDELGQNINDYLFKIRDLGGQSDKYKEVVEDLRLEYNVIREEATLVNSSHEHNANRLRNLQDCNNRLQKLNKKVISTYKLLSGAEDPFMKAFSANNKRFGGFR